MGTRTPLLTELIDAHPEAAGTLEPLVRAARLDDPVPVGPEAAERSAHPYAWLVEHVGPDGLRLTESGYLPPSSVAAAAREFDLARRWRGSLQREDVALPVLALRETALRLGLLRRRGGMLRRSGPAAAALGDPVAMWRLVAAGLPFRYGRRVHRGHAGVLLLLAVAGDSDSPYRDVVAGLTALGWSVRGHPSVTTGMAVDLCVDTADVLGWTGSVRGSDLLGTLRSTPQGVLLARAALGAPVS